MNSIQNEVAGKSKAIDKIFVLSWLGTLLVFAVYILINVWMYEGIMRLVKGAANPWFAALIIVATLVGQVLTVWQGWRLLSEAHYLNHLRQRMHVHVQEAEPDLAEALHDTLQNDQNSQHMAVWKLFGQLSEKRGRVQGPDQVLLETQLKNFEDQIHSRAVLPQYLANTLIGLGLFGTFLGLIVTLKEVALLISVFATTGNVDANDMMGQFFQKMSGPLGGMGEAFVASLLGLGGSIVNNVQLLAFKRLQKLLTHQAEECYLGAAESWYGQQNTSNDSPVALDMRMVERQSKEMMAMRVDMRKQTDAILMAASRMRQTSEALEQFLAKQNTENSLHPRLEHAAVVVEQRLDALLRKFDDSQQAQHGQLNVARDLNETLKGMTAIGASLASAQAATSRETADLRASMAQEATLGRDALRQHAEGLRQAMQAEIQALAVYMAEGARQQKEQGQVLDDINTHTRESVLGLNGLVARAQHIADQLKPQIIDLVARLEANDQALSSVVQHDWNELQHKVEKLQASINAKSPRAD